MIPIKFAVTWDPPQIGLLYKKSPSDEKKQLFVIQLGNLIFLGDPDKIVRILFKKHAEYLSLTKISFLQVRNLIIKLLEYLQEKLMAYEQEEEGEMEGGEYELPEEMTPEDYIAAVKAGLIKPTEEELAQLGLLEGFEDDEDEDDRDENDRDEDDRDEDDRYEDERDEEDDEDYGDN